MLGKIEDRRKRGRQEDEMLGWHHRLNGEGFGWPLGVGDRQGSLVCCSSWGPKAIEMNWKVHLEIKNLYSWSLIYAGSTYEFLTWWWYESNAFCRNCTSNFDFWSFHRIVTYVVWYSGDAGQWQHPELPVNHTSTRVNNQHATFSAQITILLFNSL